MIDENALHARTQDAYSFDRYGAEAWMNAIRLLIELYDEEDTEWILRSKYMRWAADRFHVWVPDDPEAEDSEGHELLDGSEIIQYRDYTTIDIEDD